MEPSRVSWGPAEPSGEGMGYSVFRAVGPVLVMVTNTRPSVESMDMLGRRTAELRADHAEGVFILVVREPFDGVMDGEPLPEDARRRGKELLRQLEQDVAGIAYCYEGGGFAASIVRMTFRALVMMSPVRTHVAPSVEGSLRWIDRIRSSGAGAPVPLDRLIWTVRELRAALALASVPSPRPSRP